MVLNVSGEIEEEDTEDGDFDLFSDVDHENIVDSDMSDIPHGSVMANPRITSLFTTHFVGVYSIFWWSCRRRRS